jgi:hypothetical protein
MESERASQPFRRSQSLPMLPSQRLSQPRSPARPSIAAKPDSAPAAAQAASGQPPADLPAAAALRPAGDCIDLTDDEPAPAAMLAGRAGAAGVKRKAPPAAGGTGAGSADGSGVPNAAKRPRLQGPAAATAAGSSAHKGAVVKSEGKPAAAAGQAPAKGAPLKQSTLQAFAASKLDSTSKAADKQRALRPLDTNVLARKS